MSLPAAPSVIGFVAGLMDEQYRLGLEAFLAFQALVREHEGSIVKDIII